MTIRRRIPYAKGSCTLEEVKRVDRSTKIAAVLAYVKAVPNKAPRQLARQAAQVTKSYLEGQSDSVLDQLYMAVTLNITLDGFVATLAKVAAPNRSQPPSRQFARARA
jgi:hypothetical protein